MSDFSQVPFGALPAGSQPFGFAADFADNPEPRCPCVLLLDTSGSMLGQPIAELNAGLAAFKTELAADSLAVKRVEVAVITFGPVAVQNPFQTSDVFQPKRLQAEGDTPMGAAIIEAIYLVEERKKVYQTSGIAYYRPWIFLITDGAPTDDWHQAASLLREGVEKKKFAFFAVAVEGADMATLARLSPRQPARLDGLKFRELFKWLSNSLGTVSRSALDQDTLALPPPSGWTQL